MLCCALTKGPNPHILNLSSVCPLRTRTSFTFFHTSEASALDSCQRTSWTAVWGLTEEYVYASQLMKEGVPGPGPGAAVPVPVPVPCFL